MQDQSRGEIAGDIIEQICAAPDGADCQRVGFGVVVQRRHRGVGQTRAKPPPAGQGARRIAVGHDQRIACVVGIVEAADQQGIDPIGVDEAQRSRADEIGGQVAGQDLERRALVGAAKQVLAVGDKEARIRAQVELDGSRGEAGIGWQRQQRIERGSRAEEDAAEGIVKEATTRQNGIDIVAGAIVECCDEGRCAADPGQIEEDDSCAWIVGPAQRVLRHIDSASGQGDSCGIDVVEHKWTGELHVNDGITQKHRGCGNDIALGIDNGSG